MRLTLMEFFSLDGVSQGPGAPDEDTSDGFTQGGWLVPHMDEEFMQLVANWVNEADAFLFGRRTYENFARDWPKVTDPDDPFAPKLNGLPKYVASHSLARAEWAWTAPGRGHQRRVRLRQPRPGCQDSITRWSGGVPTYVRTTSAMSSLKKPAS